MPEPQDQYKSTPSLYRPAQIEEAKAEIEDLSGVIDPNNVSTFRTSKPVRIRAQRQLATIRTNLDRYTPKPYAGDELDKAKAESDALREAMVADGMPTSAEMRRCPPGTVDKHRAWEARNKNNWLRWKYLVQRLHAGSDARDTANFERHRPQGGAAEADLSVSLVPSKDFHFGPAFGQDVPTVMTDAELGMLKTLDPKLAGQVALLDAEGRDRVRDVVRGLLDDANEDINPSLTPALRAEIEGSGNSEDKTTPSAKPKRKSNWSPERRKAFGENMKAARDKAAAERAKSKE